LQSLESGIGRGWYHPRVATNDPLTHALVADDSRITRALTAEILKEHGVTVRQSSDGKEALELALEHRPQLLILDGLMPGLTAFDVVGRLREEAPDYRPVVFIMTAMYKSRRWEAEARTNLGVEEYLEKPVEPEDLVAALGRHFRLEGPGSEGGH
jgi:CheY-like chemotaxis protein